jgi:Fic family protein
MEKKIKKPLKKNKFLAEYILVPEDIPFLDKEVLEVDKELESYGKAYLNPDIERNLMSKNELLASFAISKAEDSKLTLQEAQSVYEYVKKNAEFDFIHKKLKKNEKLTQSDYDKMEFYNIAKTFRYVNSELGTLEDLNAEKIKEIHEMLTKGLDIFKKHILKFDVYKSGKWRDNDEVRVDEYVPPAHKDINKNVSDLVDWLKKDFSIRNIAIFHTALYAIHPFCNGNKRICRVLEHVLFRIKGLNKRNLYSTSYYYHSQKPKYIRRLYYSITRENLSHFVSFILEALIMSIVGVYKASIEYQRREFIDLKTEDDQQKRILKSLIKNKELRFTDLLKRVKHKMARQTFVNKLKEAEGNGIVKRRESGKTVFYSLEIETREEAIFKKLLGFVTGRLEKVSEEYKFLV